MLRIGTERRVLQDASDHPFIARMHYAFQNHRQLFFVLDFCAGGDLYFHLTKYKNSRFKHFTDEMTQFYAAQLILAIEHLHNQGIVYRDLKLENVRVHAPPQACLPSPTHNRSRSLTSTRAYALTTLRLCWMRRAT